jgi:3-oxoacyl-[acyl-carrier protein] reductase
MKVAGKTNKVAVITGGTRGLGMEIAVGFCRSGYKTAVNYLNSVNEAAALSDRFGVAIITRRADVSIASEMAAFAIEVSDKWGRVDVLINNAGITKDSLLIRQSEKDWGRIIDVNLKGAFNAIKAFAPLMKEGGHIINISSYSGLKGKEGQSAYSASKSALIGLTKTAAIELAERKIRVNAILPGYMPTEMGIGSETAMNMARQESLFNALSDPAEVASFIFYLAGTKNITGQIFCLDSRIV